MARILADLAKTTARGFFVTELNFALWDFSLRLYSQPGVASACLSLQDNYGADVNVLLWSMWLENQQKRLNQERLHLALTLITPWVTATILPLRQMRRQLKNHYGTTDSQIENLRQTIKQAELQAEQQEQWQLYALAINWPADTSAVSPGENLLSYLNHLNIPVAVSNNLIKQICPTD
jgi:uncharacterized protein (TIGR02444 family)